MYKKNKIGLIGCGLWGRNILRDLVTLGCEVHVVARSKGSIKKATDGKAYQVYSKIDEMPAVDGYISAVPSEMHASIIFELLEKQPNIPIFTEKPLCVSAKDAKSLAKKGKGKVFVMDKWRYHAGILALKKLIKDKSLGRPLGFKAVRVGWGLVHDDVDTIWHLAPHDISIFLEIFGFIPKPKSAAVEINEKIPTGMIALLGDKPFFVLEVSSTSPKRLREFKVYFEKGVAVLNDAYDDSIEIYKTSGNLSQRDKTPRATRIKISDEMPLFKEIEAFLEYLNGGPTPRSSVEEGANIVLTISKLRKLAGLKT